MSAPRRAPVTQRIDDDVCAIGIDPTLYREARQFEPQDGDIILVTFPRSGSHWIQQIIQLILEKGESSTTREEFCKRAPMLEMHKMKPTKAPRLIRTHLPLGKIKFSKKAKYVYVARNPWDCCVSCFHIVRETPDFKFSDGTFDEFLDSFLGAQLGYDDYFDHVMAAFDLKGEPNVFFVTYEELQEHKADVIHRLAHFLGEEYARCLRENKEVFRRVMERSTVSFMKEFLNPSLKHFKVLLGNEHGGKDTGQGSSSGATDDCNSNVVNFIRQGSAGEWKKYFSPENVQAMQAYIDAKTKGSNVMSIWKDTQVTE